MIFNDKKIGRNYKKEIEYLRVFANQREDSMSLKQREYLKKEMLSKLDQKNGDLLAKHKFFYVSHVVVGSLALLLLSGTAYASNNALPGDKLFPVRKATEKVRLALTPSTQSKAELKAVIAEERLDAISKVREEHKAEAEVEAEEEVVNAVDVLSGVKADLEEKGNVVAAEKVQKNILRIQTKAETKLKAKHKPKSLDGLKEPRHKDFDPKENDEKENDFKVEIK